MTIEGLRAAHRTRPFRPFTIHTASGESYFVSHPELCSFSPDVRLVVVMPGGDHVAMIDFDNISEVTYDFMTPRPASAE